MRIISGSARGTRLESLEGENTRPTLDRIKESAFNIIQNKIQEADVLDVFSGSGALAIESLSRGAKFAVLNDNSFKAIEIIKNNLKKTHLEDKAKVIKNDYTTTLKNLGKDNKFDIIFIDPPYANDTATDAVKKIIEYELLKDNGIIILETDQEERDLKELENINVNTYDLRSYGRVKIIFLNRKG